MTEQWKYNGQPFTEVPEGVIAMVYLITNKLNGHQYVGKKLFVFTRTKLVKGKKKRVKKASDWESYYGSSNSLSEDVELLGREHFTREVLHLCRTKGTASYLEMKEQILRGVLESENFYNDQIRARVHRSHIRMG